MSALSKGDGTVTEENFKDELKTEFGESKVTDSTITKSADGKTWTVTIDEVTQDVKAGTVAPVVTSSLTPEELAALATQNTKDSNDQIAEITGKAITNDNLKNNDKIKAVLTGEVPLTTEMTYVTGTKDTGVVVSIDNSEFVWVPVPVAITSSAPSTTGGDLAANPTTERPMAILQSGSETNYQGILYDFSGTTSTAKSIKSVTGDSGYREPAYLTNSSYADASSYNNVGITQDSLQGEYNSVVASIAKYGGFYVGRYELGIEGEGKNPVSKPASDVVTTANSKNTGTDRWYGLYSKCKSFSATNLTSTMMWGSQYDAMMNWMAKTGKTVGKADSNKYNQEQTTGSKAEDIINNVKDLYGCHYEWTLEANDTGSRVYRGGSYYDSVSPSYRYNNYPSSIGGGSSSRLSLYIK